MSVEAVIKAMRRFKVLERENPIGISQEAIRDLDRYFRALIFSDKFSKDERILLQDEYINLL